MNDHPIQDIPFMDLLTHNLDSSDVKKFINSLDMTKDDDSAIQALKRSYETYISNESLSTGDVVSWKPGMRNRTLPNYRQPAIVIEKLQYPIFDESQNAGSQYFHEPLDLRVGFLDDNNQFVTYFYDSRRFATSKVGESTTSVSTKKATPTCHHAKTMYASTSKR